MEKRCEFSRSIVVAPLKIRNKEFVRDKKEHSMTKESEQ